MSSSLKHEFFHEYFKKWIAVYKEGAVRDVTLAKYFMTQSWIKKLAPDLRICGLNRLTYQKLLNDYAEYHERQTTMDFHHRLKDFDFAGISISSVAHRIGYSA